MINNPLPMRDPQGLPGIPMTVRPAFSADQTSIANLIYFEPNVHRHLDWRGPLEWLGAPEYWVLEDKKNVLAALACPPDPQDVAWLRLFVHSASMSSAQAWKPLWEQAQAVIKGRSMVAAAITTADWFSELLAESDFEVKQNIVVLEKNSVPARGPDVIPQSAAVYGVTLRPMTAADLPAVAEVDKAGFAPLWRNSLRALDSGFMQAGFATVAVADEEVVGYQISTRNSFGAHLARLAVSPQMQGRGIGSLLVQDLFNQGWRAGLRRFTVNTQNDNRSSLALYKKSGFELTGERYAVYTYQF